MKKIIEKNGMLRCTGALMDILAFILFIVSAFVNETTPDMTLKIVGLTLFVIGSLIISINSKEHQLSKSILAIFISAVIGSWLFTYGNFQGVDFQDYGMSRIGLVDIGYTIYYAINFIIDKIAFLLVLAGFYGILSKVSGYQKFVENVANKLNNHPCIASVLISIFLIVITSLFTQSFAVLVFVPFFVSVLYKMGFDKLTTYAITFGSLLVGILGCTYGTDSLAAFNHYISAELTVGLTYRFIIFGVALVLYNFFIVMRVRKITTVKEEEKEEVKTKGKGKKEEVTVKSNLVETDPFKLGKVKNEKTKALPAIIVLSLMAIIIILGFISWNGNFEITIFDEFHQWLTELEAGEEFTIISYILGSNANALGAFKFTFTINIVLLVVSVLLAFLYKMKVDEYFDAFFDGLKKMFKPILYLIGAYTVFGVLYLSPFIPTVANFILNLVEGFNPFLTTIVAFITSLFQSDFGYSAYTIGSFLTTAFSGEFDIVHTIFVSMYGIVQILMPTSAIMVVGLSLMNVKYKDWFKYIWLFVLGMIIILLVLFTVLYYI